MVRNLVFLMVLMVFGTACNQQSPTHFFKNADAKYNLQNYAGAIDDLNRAIELDSDYKNAYYLRALSFIKMDDPQNALSDFNKVIELDPDFQDAYLNRAFYVKIETGDYRGAIEDFNTYLELDGEGNHAYALNNRGYAKYKLGNYREALQDIDQSMKLKPANSYAYRNRALVYIAVDSIDKACGDLHKADSLGYAKEYGENVADLINKYCD